MPKTARQMIVHHAGGLHVGVDHGTAHEFKIPLFKVFADHIAQCCRCLDFLLRI